MLRTTKIALLVATLTILAVVAAGVMIGPGPVTADSPTAPAGDRSISVAGVGQATAEPDKAILTVVISAEGENPTAVRDDLATGTQELTSALDDLDVEYESTRYQINERRTNPEPREPKRGNTTYWGLHEYTIDIPAPENLGTVIDAASATGATIENVELTLTEETRLDLRGEAITAAMADARQQADTIAAAGDLEITNVSTVHGSQQRFTPVDYNAADQGRAGDVEDAPPTEIVSGDVSVTYRVQVTYNATTST